MLGSRFSTVIFSLTSQEVVADMTPTSWAGPKSAIAAHVVEQSKRQLDAYRVHPTLIAEHANIERATAQGGYGRRQLYELVQNGADALIDHSGGRISVVLTPDALFCANEGTPIDLDGVEALLASHVSMKRGREIGRFGLGFKSVLGVTRRPQFFSRSGSFGFDGSEARRRIQAVAQGSERFPVLRVAKPLDPQERISPRSGPKRTHGWADTVVKLPRNPNRAPWISEDLKQFPAEFLVFSPHVGVLELDDRIVGSRRRITLTRADEAYSLEESRADQSQTTSTWRVFETMHRPSAAAKEDAGELADREEVPVIWAVPFAGRPGRGQFWAFFPTTYITTLSGIINAPGRRTKIARTCSSTVCSTKSCSMSLRGWWPKISDHWPLLKIPHVTWT